MTAFRHAMDVGVDMIETDIRQTRDHRLVLMHDGRVDRTTDGEGLVREYSYQEFRSLNAAAHDEGFAREAPPCLEELLEMVSAHPTMLMNLELKEYPHVEGEEMAYDTAGKLLSYMRKKYGRRYPLHGYYPYFYMGSDMGDPETYLDVACVFHAELVGGQVRGLGGEIAPQAWFDYLLKRNIEPWIGAGVKTFDDLKLGFERGARLVTSDDPGATLAMLREMGHHR